MTRSAQENGFSLIEVIVALGILSTAAVSLGTLARGSIEGVRQLEKRYLARTIADNELARVFIERVPLRVEITQGQAQQMGRDFGWVRTVTPTSQDGVLLVDIQIIDPLDESVIVQASTLKEAGQ